MKEKEQNLLLQLFENQDHFTTSKELSEILSLSERTVRTYIHNLESIVKENGAEIIAKQGYGYKLQMIRPMQFEMFLNKHQIQHVGENEKKAELETSLDRQNYILNKMLIEDEHVFLEMLADTLYISRSTLTKDMNVIKKMLEPYGLSIVSKPNYGTWIQGEENDKRCFIMNYFFKGSRFNSIQEYMDHTNYFDDIPTESFILVILDECRKNHIKLSDVMIQNVLMHLTLSIKRIEKGLQLNTFTLDTEFMNSIEYHTATNIIHRLEDDFKIQFPEEEIAYLTLHLGAKNNHPLHEPNVVIEKVEQQLDTILNQMEEELGIFLTDDMLLKNCLMEHLRPMLIRVHQGIVLKNPLLNEIMSEHRDVFDDTKMYLSKMPCLEGCEVSDDEWAYLTLHFMAAIERLQERNKLQVLVICSTGYGSAQLLKCRIEKEFSEHIHVVTEMGYFEMNEKALQGIDLIISSVNLDSVIFGIPFLHVSVFLSDQDKAAIRKFIDDTLSKRKHIEESYGKELSIKEKKEVFDTYIHKEYFQVFQGDITFESIVSTLIKRLSYQEKESYIKHMLDQIKLRENMGSIIFSETIAVPHPAIPVGRIASIAVGLVPDGVAWSKDVPNIKIVFLLSPSYLGNQGVKTMTKAIIRLIDMPEVQKELLECPKFEEFRKIFLNLM